MECFSALPFLAPVKSRVPKSEIATVFAASSSSIQYWWCKVQQACYCCRVSHLGEIESQELLKSLGVCSQNLITGHNQVSGSQLLCLRVLQWPAAVRPVADACERLAHVPLRQAEVHVRDHAKDENVLFSLFCSPCLFWLSSHSQWRSINQSAKAFSDSQCECFLPSNCPITNISVSHEKSVSSSFQIANFAPCCLLGLFSLIFLSPRVHVIC